MSEPIPEEEPRKLINVAKVKGRWTSVFICNECGHKRRTVVGIAQHILEEHPE